MNTILFIGLFQAIFATILIFGQRKKEFHHYILGTWMIALTLQFGTDLLTRHDRSYFLSNYNLIIFPFLQGPFIYLYTLFTIRGKQEFDRKHYIHLIPFLFFSIVFFASKGQPVFDPEVMMSDPSGLPWIIYLYGISIFTLNIVYAILTHKLLIANRNEIRNVFSNESNEITLTWLTTIVYLSIFFILAFYLLTAADVYVVHSGFNFGYIQNIGLTLVVFIISYFGFRQPIIFSSSEALQKKEFGTATAEDQDKYQRSGLTPEIAENYADRIVDHMENNKAYLNPKVTIYSLSEELAIPQYHITQSLNEILRKNFHTFINEYRVEEAKEKLADPKNDFMTVLGVGYDSGFNSKSSFYSIFKNMTGKSPSAFKKECRQLIAD